MVEIEIPELPWQIVGSDVLQWAGKDYLLVVDYYSKYPEIMPLNHKTAGALIKRLKVIFDRNGIPEKMIADNMPYNSAEMKRFAADWKFEIVTS